MDSAGLSPYINTTAESKSSHCFTAVSPCAKVRAQEGIFHVQIYNQSWSLSHPEPLQLSHPVFTSVFHFHHHNTWSGQILCAWSDCTNGSSKNTHNQQ